MAVRESRRIEYINVVLREHRLRKVEMTPLGLRLELSIDAAGECYQIATSADRRPNIRTLTHLLPRKTRDPLVLGFKHKTRGDIVIHLVRLPVEILECGIRMQAKQGIVVLVQRLRQLLIDLQPIRESSLLSGRSRRIGIYNSTELIAAARHHAREWGFNPNSLVKAYAEIGVQQPRLRQNPQVLAAPALPPPVAPPMLPLREDPPELLIHYNDFRPIACDDDSCPPITWDWALPEFTTVGCDDEEDGGNDEEQLFPPAAVGMFWDQLESHQTEDVWVGSLGEVSGNLSDEEYLEHFDWLDETQLSDLP